MACDPVPGLGVVDTSLQPFTAKTLPICKVITPWYVLRRYSHWGLSGFRQYPTVDGRTRTLHLGLLGHLLALSVLNKHTTDL